eukprot:UN01151
MVIPKIFRRNLPHSYKAHSSHDLVLLCHSCHEEGLRIQDRTRKALCKQYNVDVDVDIKIDDDKKKISRSARALLKNVGAP